MELKFTENENGLIDDNDKAFDTLNSLIDSEQYDEAVSSIMSIPRDKWSNKLRFLLICAYNNLKDYDNSEKELDEIAPLCKTANDRARYCYQRGYLLTETGKSVAARQFYSDALEIDPEYGAEIDIASDISDCDAQISQELDELNKFCGKLSEQIKTRCQETPDKIELTDEEFQTRLGFFPAIRKLPGFERPMGFDNYFTVLSGGDKQMTLKWFEDFFGITDKDSFFKFIQNDSACNSSRLLGDVAAFLNGKPHFDINELNKGGKFFFGNMVMYVDHIGEFLPKGGVLAWDLGEKIGYARHAFRCGLFDNSDYVSGMLSLSDLAKKMFQSWEEYMISLILGAGMYMFSEDGFSIKGSIEFMEQMSALLLSSDLADTEWGGKTDAVLH